MLCMIFQGCFKAVTIKASTPSLTNESVTSIFSIPVNLQSAADRAVIQVKVASRLQIVPTRTFSRRATPRHLQF